MVDVHRPILVDARRVLVLLHLLEQERLIPILYLLPADLEILLLWHTNEESTRETNRKLNDIIIVTARRLGLGILEPVGRARPAPGSAWRARQVLGLVVYGAHPYAPEMNPIGVADSPEQNFARVHEVCGDLTKSSRSSA